MIETINENFLDEIGVPTSYFKPILTHFKKTQEKVSFMNFAISYHLVRQCKYSIFVF